jgi:dTDP-4-amino-4,6-dideoxygalactose transaminase
VIPLLDLKAQYATIKDEILAAVSEVLESQHFILGPRVEELEKTIAASCGVKYGVGVASGTDALLLSLRAAGVGPGDEVITSTFSFFASAGAVWNAGARPVFVDINPRTFNLDAGQVEKVVTNKTKAVIPVHLFGQCAEMDPLVEFARYKKLVLIEDAAQAVGAKYKNRMAGSLGHIGCFSFYPTKNLGGTGDGGMVVTDDEKLGEAVRMLRVHGSRTKYYHELVGTNSRLDALQAAVLLVKWKHLDEWAEARRRNAGFYDAAFKGSEVKTPYAELYNYHVYNQYVIRTPDREAVMERLKKEEIGYEIYYPLPLHLQRCFADLGGKMGDFPESETAAKEVLAIPVYPELTDEQKEMVVRTVKGEPVYRPAGP